MKRLLLILLAALLLVGCGSKDSTPAGGDGADKGKSNLVRIGLTDSNSKIWYHVRDEAAKEDINIELVFFDSYPLPNAALDAGDIEMNAFQHYSYLNKEIEQHGYKLSVIGETVLAPLGIYSKQIEKLDELEDGATIVIPDDVTNGGRSLLMLETNGLIKVDPEAGELPTLKDIENPRAFNIMELAANNIPASLEEVPIAIINSGIATDAGFTPSQDALVLEEMESGDNPYINIMVVRTEDLDKEVYKRIVEIYQSEGTRAVIEEDSKGSLIPVW